MKKKSFLSLLLTSCFLMSLVFTGCKNDASNPGDDIDPGSGGEIVMPDGGNTNPSEDILNPGEENKEPEQAPNEVKPGDIIEVEPVDPATQSEESKKFDEDLKNYILGLNYTFSVDFIENGVSTSITSVESSRDVVRTKTIDRTTDKKSVTYTFYDGGKMYVYECENFNNNAYDDFLLIEVSDKTRNTENLLTKYVDDISLLQVIFGHFDDFVQDPKDALKKKSPESYRYIETYEKNGKTYYRYNLIFHDVEIGYRYNKIDYINAEVYDPTQQNISYSMTFNSLNDTYLYLYMPVQLSMKHSGLIAYPELY